jgi:hypothetical protein
MRPFLGLLCRFHPREPKRVGGMRVVGDPAEKRSFRDMAVGLGRGEPYVRGAPTYVGRPAELDLLARPS